MGSRNCAVAALLIARARAAGHIAEKSGGLMWPCDGGWACGYNACIPAATCAHARAVLLAIITGRKTPGTPEGLNRDDKWTSCTCSDDDPGVSLCAVFSCLTTAQHA